MKQQKKIARSVWYGLEGTSYDNIAQELPCKDHSSRKWVSIYAIYKYSFSGDPHQYYDFIHKSKGFRFSIVVFTLAIKEIGFSDGIDDRDVVILNFVPVNSEEDIYTVLERLAINPELFCPPWRCGYPI